MQSINSKSCFRVIEMELCMFKTSPPPPPPPDEEPEEDLSVEQMKERAEAGDARAQTRVSESTCMQADLALFSVLLLDSVCL